MQLILEYPVNSFPDFILLFDNVIYFLFFCFVPKCDTRLRMEHACFITNVTVAETLGSYHKLNSYYDYYM